MSNLIGWDKVRNVGTAGIFDIREAYGITIEEQGRKTLHAHTHVWIKDFNTVRNLLYHENGKIREESKEEMITYIEKVMSSSYGSLYVSKEVNGIYNDKNNAFNMTLADKLLDSVSDQKLRNMRHKYLCMEEKGIVSKNLNTNQEFSTVRIVNSVQGWHNFFINKEDIYIETFPMKKERQEMYCIRTIYDIDSDNWNHISIDPSKRLVKKSRHNGRINFEQSVDSRRTLLNLRFNEHVIIEHHVSKKDVSVEQKSQCCYGQ